MQADPRAHRGERIRRARREDVAALLNVVGGPQPGRLRALRRLTKTLTADLYVLDRAAEVRGVVAVVYRRSLTHGGLTATIDAVHAWPDGDREQASRDTAALLATAISRARRRGCVAIDTALPCAEVRALLQSQGFTAGASQLVLELRDPTAAAKREPS
jgi:N-acetylglutamate synthase-like GNAT family acetyltransferase